MNLVDILDAKDVLNNPQTNRERAVALYCKRVKSFDKHIDDIIDDIDRSRDEIDSAEHTLRTLSEQLEGLKGKRS